MNEVEKLQASADKIAKINSALNKSAHCVLKQFGPLRVEHPQTALRYLASLCATVVGGYTEIANPTRSPEIIAKLITVEMEALAAYIASNSDNLIEIEAEEN